MFQGKGKVKCTLVQALRFCTGRTARRGNRGIVLPFHDHGTRRVWGVSVKHRPLFTPGKDTVPILQEAGRTQGPVWTGAENFEPTGIRSPDLPARSQSLYRLSYPSPSVSRGGNYTVHTTASRRSRRVNYASDPSDINSRAGTCNWTLCSKFRSVQE
jgi:hypothetical protein